MSMTKVLLVYNQPAHISCHNMHCEILGQACPTAKAGHEYLQAHLQCMCTPDGGRFVCLYLAKMI